LETGNNKYDEFPIQIGKSVVNLIVGKRYKVAPLKTEENPNAQN
jgi:hypothetical protein